MRDDIKRFRKRRYKRLMNRWDSLDVQTQAMLVSRDDKKDLSWITANGNHILIDPDSKKVVGGANGAMNGKTLTHAHPVSLSELQSNTKYKRGKQKVKIKTGEKITIGGTEFTIGEVKPVPNAKTGKKITDFVVLKDKDGNDVFTTSDDIQNQYAKSSEKEQKENGVEGFGNGKKQQGISGNIKGRDYVSDTGVKFPNPKGNAKWDTEVLDEMAKTYEERGLTKEFQKAVSNIKPEDITYQKDLEGNDVACVIGLAAKFDNKCKGKSDEVQRIYDEGTKNAPKITNDLLDICGKNGIMLSGLENNTKTGNSMAKKIDKKKAEFAKSRDELNAEGKDGTKRFPDLTDEEMAETFTDNIRFTMMSNHKDLAKNVNEVCSLLEKRGYKINEVDNKYFPPSDGSDHLYKAVHIGVIAPSGEEFEVQIHSPEALAIKSKSHEEKNKADSAAIKMRKALDSGNRAEYEKQKKIKEKHDANMVKLWKSLPDPDGIMELQNVTKKRNIKQEVIDRHNANQK